MFLHVSGDTDWRGSAQIVKALERDANVRLPIDAKLLALLLLVVPLLFKALLFACPSLQKWPKRSRHQHLFSLPAPAQPSRRRTSRTIVFYDRSAPETPKTRAVWGVWEKCSTAFRRPSRSIQCSTKSKVAPLTLQWSQASCDRAWRTQKVRLSRAF